MTRLLLALCAFGLLVSACQRRPELVAVPLPDMAQSDPPVQQQVREQHAAVMQKVEAGAPDAELGAAFGDLAVLLHAADYLDAAEPAYRNAERLAPEAAEWPYLLGHLYRNRGDVTHAADAFRRALEEAPGDVPTLVWLGRLSVDQGLADEAEALLVRAQAADSRSVAVVAGLGQAALARKDYQRAASRLEEALSIDPRVLAVHAPLAAAYRGLGDTAKADRHARLWVNTEIPLEDPLLDRLAAALESGASYESRGVKAMDAGRLDEAVGLFRQGLALTPAGTPLARSIRHKLGLVLHLQGDVKGAVQQFEEAVRLAPAGGRDEPAAQAHYSLGIVMAAGGRDIEAIEHLTKAVSFNAKYGQARLALGDALRRSGRFDAALPQYLEAVQVNPQSVEARLGYALALMRLGRWVDARQWLDEAVSCSPRRCRLRTRWRVCWPQRLTCACAMDSARSSSCRDCWRSRRTPTWARRSPWRLPRSASSARP